MATSELDRWIFTIDIKNARITIKCTHGKLKHYKAFIYVICLFTIVFLTAGEH